MSKKSKIRWRQNDVKELERAIKNFNAKLYRLEKKHPEMKDYLPERIHKKAMQNRIETRADFNFYTERMKKFSIKGSEKLVDLKSGKATQWQVHTYEELEGRENKRREKERKRLEDKEVTSRGKGTGQKRSQMGSVKENAVKPTHRKPQNLTQKEFQYRFKMIDKLLSDSGRLEMQLRMKDNYIKGLIDAGFSNKLINKVESVDINKFIDTIDTDTEASFDFIYSPEEIQVKEQVLMELWENVVNG